MKELCEVVRRKKFNNNDDEFIIQQMNLHLVPNYDIICLFNFVQFNLKFYGHYIHLLGPLSSQCFRDYHL